jgi:hypothetical protein
MWWHGRGHDHDPPPLDPDRDQLHPFVEPEASWLDEAASIFFAGMQEISACASARVR